MLDLYYGDLRAHELAHRTALAASDSEKAEFHLDASQALADVIADSGDGSSRREPLHGSIVSAWTSSAYHEADDARERCTSSPACARTAARPLRLTPTYRAAISRGRVGGGGVYAFTDHRAPPPG